MHFRTLALVCITLAALCHPQLRAQALINVAPPPAKEAAGAQQSLDSLPGDPGQEILPLAELEPEPATGVPVRFEADEQSWSEVSRTWTLTGHVALLIDQVQELLLHTDKFVHAIAHGIGKCGRHSRQSQTFLDAGLHQRVLAGGQIQENFLRGDEVGYALAGQFHQSGERPER